MIYAIDDRIGGLWNFTKLSRTGANAIDAAVAVIEGYFSIFKRGMKGEYQRCSEKHLHRYLAGFDFRYNNRSASVLKTSNAPLTR